MKKSKSSYFIFRYFSSRGTDQRICAKMPKGTTRMAALEAAKDWAERSTAGTACHEYTVTVRKIHQPPTRSVWLREWKKRCAAYQKASDRRDDWGAITNPREFE